MSDAVLRELERRWQATRDPGDEARLLAERVRAGDLALELLELAAWIGHGPARLALGDAAPAGEHIDVKRWARAPGEAVRLALARARARELRARTRLPETDRDPAGALAAAEAWCACPCADHAAAVRERAAAADAYKELLVEQRRFDEAAELRDQGAFARALGMSPEGRSLRDLLQQDPRPRAALLVPTALGGAHPALLEDGSTSAAVGRYLAGRLARGEVGRERLELAAYAGHAPAALALGEPFAAPGQELIPWLRGLSRLGERFAVRGAVDAAREAFRLLDISAAGWAALDAWLMLSGPEDQGPPEERAGFAAALARDLRGVEEWLGRARRRSDVAARPVIQELFDLALRLLRTLRARPSAETIVETLEEVMFGADHIPLERDVLSRARRALVAWALRHDSGH